MFLARKGKLGLRVNAEQAEVEKYIYIIIIRSKAKSFISEKGFL
jgi:hypothetical protein